jgi:hypothetical protein
MKMRSLVVAAIVLSAALAASQCSLGTHVEPAFQDLPFRVEFAEIDEPARVEGEPIVSGELQIFAQLNRNRIADQFRVKHGVVLTGDSWQVPVEGKVPLEELRRVSLMAGVRYKLSEVMGREVAIRGAIDFDNLLLRWREENERRAQLHRGGEELYGPVVYTLLEFFEQDRKSLDLALIQTLEQKGVLRAEGRGREALAGTRFQRMQVAFKTLMDERVSEAHVTVNREELLALDLLKMPSPSSD